MNFLTNNLQFIPKLQTLWLSRSHIYYLAQNNIRNREISAFFKRLNLISNIRTLCLGIYIFNFISKSCNLGHNHIGHEGMKYLGENIKNIPKLLSLKLGTTSLIIIL